MRAKLLTLLATAMAVVGLGVLPSLASAATPESTTPAAIQSLPADQEARVKSDCPASYICFWSGKTFGTAECQAGLNCFSAFHGYEVGYHALENINPQSVYNHTGERLAWFSLNWLDPGFGVWPGEAIGFGGRWNAGFEIS